MKEKKNLLILKKNLMARKNLLIIALAIKRKNLQEKRKTLDTSYHQ